MSDQESRSGSLGLMLAIVLVAVIAGVAVVFVGGRDDATSGSVDESASPQAGAVPRAGSGEKLSRGPAQTLNSPVPRGFEAREEVEPAAEEVYEASLETPMGDIPPEILEDFRRGMIEPTEEEHRALAPGMDAIPAEIRDVFEQAARRPIPQHILDDFENPYPEGRSGAGQESGEAEAGGSGSAEAP